MPVTIDDINIETILSISEVSDPLINRSGIGYAALQNAPHLKNEIHDFDISGIWSDAPNDFTNKKKKIQNIQSSGLPVWIDAQSWATNQLLFGKIANFNARLTDARVNIYDFSFKVLGVAGWGYIFVQDPTTNFVIYDLDKLVQSKKLDPLIRNCGFSKTIGTPGTLTFQVYVKNTGSTATATLEMFVPDGLGVGSIAATSSAGGVITKVAGDIGAGGISNTFGTKRRITLAKSITGGIEELWTITISYTSTKTSYLDGSADDTAV